MSTKRSARDDLAACWRVLRAGSNSFAAAATLLPRRVRRPVAAVYAFCRVADDAIDTPAAGEHALSDLQSRLDAIYAGQPRPLAVDRAFARVVAEHGLPRALPEALIEGFDWDVTGRRYETLSDVRAYSMRVAGTVGLMMALLMGRRSPAALARACDLGVAMQLTNISRDVGEDALAGRLYLPQAWMRQSGVDVETFLRRPRFSADLGAVVARLLRAAAELYDRADDGIAHLPRDCRVAIRAARLIYSAIGREIGRAGFDSVSRRAVVSGPHKLLLLSRATDALLWRSARGQAPVMPEALALIESCAG